MEGKKNENVKKNISLVDTRFTDSSTGKVSNWFGYLYYCTDLYNGMWKLEKILENIYKRLNELEISKKQQLSEIVSELEEIKTLQQTLGKISALEAEVTALRAENEQLKQNAQQDSETLSTADLALITSLVGISHETLRDYLGNEKAQKVQYFAEVAFARAFRNVDAENHAYSKAANWANYHDYYNGGYEWADKWYKETENKSALEIVGMIKQMMNTPVVEKDDDKRPATKYL